MTDEDDDDLDLDFTKPVKKPAPAPPPERVAKAKKEAAKGQPELARTGFYVAMARRPGEPVVPRDGKRHSILVVDDDTALVELVTEILGKAGFHTRSARNRTEINAEFNKVPMPDLVLLDVTLPDSDGFAILERIRGNRKITQLPVIMMTGKSAVTDIARGLSLGADGYVTKPFKLSGLVAAVNTVLALD